MNIDPQDTAPVASGTAENTDDQSLFSGRVIPSLPSAAPQGQKESELMEETQEAPFYLVRPWHAAETGMTEIQGRAVEAMQRWEAASHDAERMGELDATEQLEAAMFEWQRGTLENYAEEIDLTQEETDALATVGELWQKWAKHHEANARILAKRRQNCK